MYVFTNSLFNKQRGVVLFIISMTFGTNKAIANGEDKILLAETNRQREELRVKYQSAREEVLQCQSMTERAGKGFYVYLHSFFIYIKWSFIFFYGFA